MSAVKHTTPTRVGALLLFVVLTLPNWSVAQTASPITNELPLLVQVTNAPLKMLFRSYSDEGHNFRLNFSPGPIVFSIPEVGMPVADRFGKTGYFLKKFERKMIGAGPGMASERDVSELTLQHEGEDPIVLVLGQVQAVREPIARIVCPGSAQTQDVRRSQYFFRYGDTGYKVTDIKPKQMTIMDVKSGEQKAVLLSASKK